jgi:hypothetical protein
MVPSKNRAHGTPDDGATPIFRVGQLLGGDLRNVFPQDPLKVATEIFCK